VAFFPVSYQLWFILALLIYNIAYPLLRWCVSDKIVKWIFFSIAIMLWLGTFSFLLIEGEGLLFFSVGIWIQKTSFDIDKPNRLLNTLPWGILFITFVVIKIWLAFNGETILGDAIYRTLTLLHKLTELSGVITVWFGLDRFVKYFMKRKWFVWATAFSFIIYVLHAPFVVLVIDKVFTYENHFTDYRIFTFIFLAPVIIFFCIGIGFIIRKIWPSGYALLTGGRGLG
jgi:hypothetical protein